MKPCRTLALALLLTAGCSDEQLAPSPPGCTDDMDETACVEHLLGLMTLEEKVAQMHGSALAPIDGLYPTPDNQRLGIGGFRMVDGPRGVRAGNATAFPVGMARGATWDIDLERAVGEAIGKEVAAKGGNVLLAPTINVLRHPAWGRAQETYGEDPLHIGLLGAAFIEGAQRHVIASAKHFALNSIEDTRFEVNVRVDERTLREVYLPQFRRAVRAGVGSVMSAYNQVNGSYCAQNAHLLRDILKGDWGFDGFVESDWIFGTRSTVESALAGLDIEMPVAAFYGPKLVDAVARGEVPIDRIDESVTRILRIKRRFRIDRPPPFGPEVVESEAHTALARRVAEEALVLLENDGALPLADVSSLAVVGALADRPNLGDEGSSNVTPSEVVTPLAGLAAALPGVTLTHVATDTPAPHDLDAIAEADAAVIVVGLTAEDEGENLPTGGGDRHVLSLSEAQEQLIADVAAANARTIVVLEGGSAITMESWIDQVPAVLMAWYPGAQGGHAIAGVLTGAINPSGKLPITIPASESQLVDWPDDDLEVTYDALHGYRHLEREGHEPRFPFGFGLSYTTFAYADLSLDPSILDPEETDRLTITLTLTNTGDRPGDEIVQLYIHRTDPRALRAFARVALEAGESTTVTLEVPLEDLAIYDPQLEAWRIERGTYQVEVGPSSRDLPLSTSFEVK